MGAHFVPNPNCLSLALPPTPTPTHAYLARGRWALHEKGIKPEEGRSIPFHTLAPAGGHRRAAHAQLSRRSQGVNGAPTTLQEGLGGGGGGGQVIASVSQTHVVALRSKREMARVVLRVGETDVQLTPTTPWRYENCSSDS
jgi:hypothetical protein